MPEPKWVDVLVDGEPIRFHQWPSGADLEAEAAEVEDLNIGTCIKALEAHARHYRKVVDREESDKIELTIILDHNKLFPWENNVFSIGIYRPDDEPYCADFTLNTAIGVQPHALREAILTAISGTGFELYYLAASTSERPAFEEDGWHIWTCQEANSLIITVFGEEKEASDSF